MITPGNFHSPGAVEYNGKIQSILHGWGVDPKRRAVPKKERTGKKKPPRQAPKERDR